MSNYREYGTAVIKQMILSVLGVGLALSLITWAICAPYYSLRDKEKNKQQKCTQQNGRWIFIRQHWLLGTSYEEYGCSLDQQKEK